MQPRPSAIDSQITTETQALPAAPLIVVAADTCSACGTPLAADQRYCVECGQRCGAPRLPALDGPGVGPGAQRPSLAAQPAGAAIGGRLSPAATLAAVVGTLLLAVAIGVFIGRSGNDSSSSRAATQVVSVIAPPAAAGTGVAAATATTPAATAAATGAASSAAAKKAAATKTAAAPVKKVPTPAIVKVGSKGTGPGYQNGKFTGNFFGGG